MNGEITFTTRPLSREEIDIITDAEFEHTDKVMFQTPKGKKVTFVKERLGEWLFHKDVGKLSGIVYSEYHTCSVCGERAIEDGDWEDVLSDFCPNCGARMKEPI